MKKTKKLQYMLYIQHPKNIYITIIFVPSHQYKSSI